MSHRMKQAVTQSRLAFLSILLAMAAALTFASSNADAALSTPVKAPNFNGTLNVVGFTTTTVNGVTQLAAIGSLTGTLSAPNGTLRSVAIGNLVIPATVTSPTCPVLHLDLGPLNVDLLGLVVHLDQIVLDITAVGGAGNLLGNLLCQVAGLLDPSQLSALVNLLNSILAAL